MVNEKAIDWGTFALFLIGAIGSAQAYILGYIPIEYVPLATAIFGVISQAGSLFRSKKGENTTEESESASDDSVA